MGNELEKKKGQLFFLGGYKGSLSELKFRFTYTQIARMVIFEGGRLNPKKHT